MKTAKLLSLATVLTLSAGLACKKPEPAPKVDTAAEDAAKKAAAEKAAAEEAARKAAEEAARKAAEEAARKKAEEEEAARKAAAEKAAAFKAAADKALVNIHFDYDKADIKAGDRAILQGIADFMKANASIKVVIEGHCDERGTNEYNLALGNPGRGRVPLRDHLLRQGEAHLHRGQREVLGPEPPCRVQGQGLSPWPCLKAGAPAPAFR